MAPIAVVGMAFRFPGDLNDEKSLWHALKEGRDAVGQLGSERWAVDELQHPKRSEPGRSITFSAGMLSRIEEFDATFFGISPREAAWLDPQQRLLLELAWEAMENGGHVPSELAGTDCSVYVGISGLDYGIRGLDDLSSMTAYSMTGNTLSMAANRLSYVFDLHGPSLAVDTACSSSLVALHHACSSLRSGESSAALVGGVNLLLHPYPFIGFTKASMLSANGRCRAFDESGDGYVRAEGGAVFLLKRLDQALADGDHIQAVILATGANADGSRKSGITIPSSAGQAELMRTVMQRAGIQPGDVDYIEAHGTGTAVGDPIETAAIGSVYGQGRPAGKPLAIGSVKTNLGHLEPASGMAGLVKAILVLKNRAVPPSLHLVTPNPRIDFSGLNLEVVTAYRPLSKPENQPLIAGVNSFGFGGANAHVLLQAHCMRAEDQWDAQPGIEQSLPPLFLSARSPQALRDMAGRYAEALREKTPAGYYDMAYGAAFRREQLENRLALKTTDIRQATDLLTRFAQGEPVEQVFLEDKPAQPGEIAFIYSGNGAQWAGMGQRLIAESPRFAELLAALDTSIQFLSGFSILQELQADETGSRLDDTAIAQPLLFAIQVALTTLLREQGVEPAAVAGHSVGEVAAAWAAGALSLEQAIEVICARSASQALTRGCGRMAVVGLSETTMRETLVIHACCDVEIVGFNSASNLTLAGSFTTLDRLRRTLEAQGVFFRLLDLDYAFHSQHMDAIEGNITESLSSLTPTDANAAVFVSTVTGEALQGKELGAHYWWRNVREPVRFSQAIATLAQRGCRVFVEIGSHAILQRYISECLSTEGITGRVLPTLRRNDDGLARVDEAALRVHLLSDAARRDAFFPQTGRHTHLPNYPWQRERHWLPNTSDGYNLIERRRVHPLLGWRLKDADAAWENTLDPATLTWLADHKVGGAVVLPGAAYVEMALAAAREWFGGEQFELEELDIVAPVVFDDEHARSCLFEFSPRDGSFTIRSRQRLSDDEWVQNAAGRLLGAPAKTSHPVPTHAVADNAPAIDQQTHYRLAATLGLDYGPAFQGLRSAQLAGEILHGMLVTPEALQETQDNFILHPAILDVCFQSLVDFFRQDIETGKGVPFLPVKVGRLQFYSASPAVAFQARLVRRSARSVLADFELTDASGHIVAVLTGCRFRAAALQRRTPCEPACWQIKSRLVPHAAEQQRIELPSTVELGKHLRAWFVDQEPVLGRSAYFSETLPLFDALTLSFAYAAFQQLAQQDQTWLQQACADPATVNSAVRPLFLWLVDRLQQESLLLDESGQWRLEASDLPAAGEIWRTLLRDSSACLPELVLVGRVGLNLPSLLAGQLDAAAFLQKLHDSHPAETLYHDSPAYLGTRLATQQMLHSLAKDWPANRRMRILEITPGASELPLSLTRWFDPDRLDYVIAQTDEAVRIRLSAEYQDQPMVIVANLVEEGFQLQAEVTLPERFDVIILRHWLHGRPQSRLAAVRRKLASGGLLLLAERHPDLNANFMFGSDQAWWYEAADLTPVSRLLPASLWKEMLAAQGFEQIETLVEPASEDLPAGGYMLLAKRPQEEQALPEPENSTWLVLADAAGPSNRLANLLALHLGSMGQRVIVAQADGIETDQALAFDPQQPDSITRVLVSARQRLGSLDHVVHLAGTSTVDTTHAFAESRSSVGFFHLIRAMTDFASAAPRLWLVTAGGALMSVMVGESDPAQASLWGLGRVVMNEYPALGLTMIDIATDPSSHDLIIRLANELLWPDEETEIVLAAEARHGLRLQQENPLATVMQEAAQSDFRLDFQVPGQLRNLKWLPQAKHPLLGEDEIEIKPVATGLNFRDIMYVMGLLPDEAVEKGYAGTSLGLECSGVVTRVGARVHDFVPGDAVMGFGSACFSSHVITQANALAPKPAEWSFESAATVPTVFFTVYYALKQLANLQPGERVLIHGGAGGVGIAAIQLAKHYGAEIYATAGSEEKRDFVRLLGADHVLDSRSLDYAEQILALTDGEGVDVVLNSLAGEAIRRNLQVLKPFGRFLELGKRDFFENTPIGLRPFKDNISYFGIDADQLLIARPELAARLFREVMTLFREGVLSPLPYRAFPAARVVDAFRTMQQARHIGKVVVAMGDAMPHIEQETQTKPELRFKHNATWLVTGGIAGFGLESARWLVRHGAGSLVLLGRRGMQTPGATQAVDELEALGARVKVVACDVSNRASLQAVLAAIQRDLPPLRGILHGAMVLDDALLANLDAERFHSVLAPKMLGARNLHDLTLDIPLDYFILYSSVTTLIGNPGQANYVAANGYLEGLASMRRSQGLPATCVGWGPIGDAGYLTRNESVRESLATRLGTAPLTAGEALAMLERLIMAESAPCAVANFDWQVLARLLPSAESARFALLRRQAGQGGSATENMEDFQSRIVGKSADEVAAIVRQQVTSEVAQILCIGAERIDTGRSLHDMGLDSLMGIELALGLEKRCGIQLPAMMLNDNPTVERVTVRIVEKILAARGQHAVETDNRLDSLVKILAAQHGEVLSSDEVAQTVLSVEQGQQLSPSGAGL